MLVHCETNCNKICPLIEKNQRSLKKSATSVTKVFNRQNAALWECDDEESNVTLWQCDDKESNDIV